VRFRDRRAAGVLLGEAVAAIDPPDPLVAALPRGGVPVGFEVASRLGCELDVLVVRKVGVPFQPELAMGAVGEGGVVIRNDEVIQATGVDQRAFDEAVERATAELERRLETYRAARPAVDPGRRTVIVVDDGLATGSTALAAIAVLRARSAREVWLAVPVAPADAVAAMEDAADRVVFLDTPRRFVAVGAWYRDFAQTTDREVAELLERSRYPSG
jgi:putative phosphoribosyl transferase